MMRVLVVVVVVFSRSIGQYINSLTPLMPILNTTPHPHIYKVFRRRDLTTLVLHCTSRTYVRYRRHHYHYCR